MLSFKIKEVDKIKLQEVNYFLIISVGAKGKIGMGNGWYRKPQPGRAERSTKWTELSQTEWSKKCP